jgi:peptidase M28-like protein
LIDIRIYRAALLPVLLALVVVMFSLENRPPPLTSSLAPDAFDSKSAYATLSDFIRHEPERRAGGVGDRRLADIVEGRFQALAGFEIARDEFGADVEGDDVSMVNVTGVVSGLSDRQLVLLAHRDAVVRPGASSAASTAVLLELAKALAGVQHKKTLVFVSADGGRADAAGARRFADSYPDRDKVDAVIVLDDIATARERRPFLVPWSSDTGRSSLQLLATQDASLRREIGTGAGVESVPGQFIRQAWPLTLREQGPLNDAGLNAVTLTSRGEVPADSGRDDLEEVSRPLLLQFGKAALATVLAVDAAGGLEKSPPTYLASKRKLMPGWAISLLAFALLAPPLAAGLDGFARARRRGRSIEWAMRWVLGASVPFLLVLAFAYVFELFGWLPATASEALAPATQLSFSEALPPLGALLLVFALAWLVARPIVIGGLARRRMPRRPELMIALVLLLSVEVLILWLSKPFAAILLTPVLHLCIALGLTQTAPRRSLPGATVAAALLLPALALLYYGFRLDLGLDPTRYALLFVAGGGSVANAVLVAAIAGSLASVVLVALVRGERESEPEITMRGPRTYAGPGSLGGTESALQR